jgi:hypothetical protein
LATADDVTNLELDEITATQLAVDRQIEQRSIAKALMFVEIKPNSPDIARLERALGPNILSCVPGAPLVISRVEV